MNAVQSPPLPLPFTPWMHPDADQIQVYAQDWARRLCLVQSESAAEGVARSQYGIFAAHTYPSAPWPEIGLAASWLTWLFLADDQYEEGSYGTKQKWDVFTESLRWVFSPESGVCPAANSPLIQAVAELSEKLDTMASPAWKWRFAKHVLDTANAVFQEIRLREEGVPPSLSAYIALRRNSYSSLPTFDTVEVFTRNELPAKVYWSPAYQEIILAAADTIAWINDLYSLEKEVSCGIVTNLVLVLQYERELDKEQAIAAGRSLIIKRANELLTAQQHLPKLCRSLNLDLATQNSVRQCAAAICDWVAGSNLWHHQGTSRYHQQPGTDPVEDLLAPTWTVQDTVYPESEANRGCDVRSHAVSDDVEEVD